MLAGGWTFEKEFWSQRGGAFGGTNLFLRASLLFLLPVLPYIPSFSPPPWFSVPPPSGTLTSLHLAERPRIWLATPCQCQEGAPFPCLSYTSVSSISTCSASRPLFAYPDTTDSPAGTWRVQIRRVTGQEWYVASPKFQADFHVFPYLWKFGMINLSSTTHLSIACSGALRWSVFFSLNSDQHRPLFFTIDIYFGIKQSFPSSVFKNA